MIGDLVAEFIKLRDARSELRRQYEQQDAALKQRQNEIEVALLQHMGETGVTLLRTDAGIAYKEVKTYGSIADWHIFTDFVAKNKMFDLFERRVKPTALQQYIDEFGTLPPGLNVHRVAEVRIRRM